MSYSPQTEHDEEMPDLVEHYMFTKSIKGCQYVFVMMEETPTSGDVSSGRLIDVFVDDGTPEGLLVYSTDEHIVGTRKELKAFIINEIKQGRFN